MEVAWTIPVVSGGMVKSGCNPGGFCISSIPDIGSKGFRQLGRKFIIGTKKVCEERSDQL